MTRKTEMMILTMTSMMMVTTRTRTTKTTMITTTKTVRQLWIIMPYFFITLS
jgi:hypothetical protein